MNEAAWKKRTEVPLMIAGFAYLVAYSWRVIADLTGAARLVASLIVAVTWAMFIIDYLVRLSMAEHRGVWFRTHFADFAFALVPVLRLVRLLRVATRLPGVRSTRGDRLRTEIMVYGAGAAVILIYISSLAVLELERHAPDANITSFGIALWWACVTVTTTGFGDYTPVTDGGRIVAVGLMFGGIALAGIITATLASLVVDLAARNNDDREPATRAQVRDLMAKVDALSTAAAGGRDASPPAPTAHTGADDESRRPHPGRSRTPAHDHPTRGDSADGGNQPAG